MNRFWWSCPYCRLLPFNMIWLKEWLSDGPWDEARLSDGADSIALLSLPPLPAPQPRHRTLQLESKFFHQLVLTGSTFGSRHTAVSRSGNVILKLLSGGCQNSDPSDFRNDNYIDKPVIVSYWHFPRKPPKMWEIEKGNEGGCDRDGKIAGERWNGGRDANNHSSNLFPVIPFSTQRSRKSKLFILAREQTTVPSLVL